IEPGPAICGAVKTGHQGSRFKIGFSTTTLATSKPPFKPKSRRDDMIITQGNRVREPLPSVAATADDGPPWENVPKTTYLSAARSNHSIYLIRATEKIAI